LSTKIKAIKDCVTTGQYPLIDDLSDVYAKQLEELYNGFRA
jgi:hypothetical protein